MQFPPEPDPPNALDAEARRQIDADVQLLNRLGYGQELLRRMSGFSNFAVSFSIICIVAGGITSFPQGFCSVGGAAIGLGWPACCLLSLCVALAMAQVASAFPTAGGLYHWAAILGGRGWGWLTAWFNLAGLVTVLAAINVGAYQFAAHACENATGFGPSLLDPAGALATQIVGVTTITAAQAFINHRGIRLTALLTDFSGYWIMLVAAALSVAMFICAPTLDWSRLVTFANYSGATGGNIWPATDCVGWLFLLGFLLPAYTVTGFDASAHTSEETIGAAHHVPRGIVRSVLVSGVFGWIMLSAIVLAAPNLDEAAAQGGESFFWIARRVARRRAAGTLRRHFRRAVLLRTGNGHVGVTHGVRLCTRRRVAIRRTHPPRQSEVSHTGGGNLVRGDRVGGLRGLYARVLDHHRGMYHFLVRLVRDSLGARPVGLRTHLEADGTVEPGSDGLSRIKPRVDRGLRTHSAGRRAAAE